MLLRLSSRESRKFRRRSLKWEFAASGTKSKFKASSQNSRYHSACNLQAIELPCKQWVRWPIRIASNKMVRVFFSMLAFVKISGLCPELPDQSFSASWDQVWVPQKKMQNTSLDFQERIAQGHNLIFGIHTSTLSRFIYGRVLMKPATERSFVAWLKSSESQLHDPLTFYLTHIKNKNCLTENLPSFEYYSWTNGILTTLIFKPPLIQE